MRPKRELEIHIRRLVRLKVECASVGVESEAHLARFLQRVTSALLDAEGPASPRLKRLMDVHLDLRSHRLEHDLDVMQAILADAVVALQREAARRGILWRVLSRVQALLGVPAAFDVLREWLKRLGGM